MGWDRYRSRPIAASARAAASIIVDKSAFVEEGALTNLFPEIYRYDGLRRAFVQLDHHLAGE